jgi:hypothetical protein
LLLASALPAAALLGCAAAAPAADMPAPTGAIVLLTAADWASAPAVAEEAARRAGVAVARATALSPRMFALTLACDSEAECRRAIARLAADAHFAADVQPDRRRSLPPRPSASSSQ